MGLTQVMLQVKGCEMVCKQRELIPRPGAIVTGTKQSTAVLLWWHTLPPSVQLAPTVSAGLSGAIKKAPKQRPKHWPPVKKKNSPGHNR